MQSMKSFLVACALAAIAPLRVVATAQTPVQQVLNMLNEMKAKGDTMMDKEQKVFAEYTEWVDDKQKELGFEIKTCEATIEKLTAFVEQAETKIAELARAIQEDESDIATLGAEKSAATKVRGEEHAEFLKLEQDHAESVDALERAIQVLSAEAYSRPGGSPPSADGQGKACNARGACSLPADGRPAGWCASGLSVQVPV